MNNNLPRYSKRVIQEKYFLGPKMTTIPQLDDRFYRFKIGEVVRFDRPKTERKFGYKFSLQGGTGPMLKFNHIIRI